MKEPLKRYKMKKFRMKLWLTVAVLGALAYAGNVEYVDDVLGHMSDGTYDALRAELGDVSNGELVDTYMMNPEYWDSLGMLYVEE